MGNILEITESRPTVRITEAGNTLQVLAPNAIVITDKKPEITVFESVPQVIVQSAGIQGPIGLNWRGSWGILLSYLKSDAINYGGKVYYCIEDVGDNPVVPPSSDTTHWDLLLSNSATGMNWVGAYSSSTAYAVLDAVEYYGSSWLCTQTSPGGNDPPVDWDSTSSYWDLIVATPFVHEGNYNSFRRYNTNQTVLQNGTMWRCMQDNVRDAPPAHPMYGDANWEYIGASGGRWMGAYVSGTQYYQNELVEYNGNSYVCTTTQTGNSPDQSGWELVASKGDQGIQGVKGLQWRLDWSSSVSYVVDDAVEYEGTAWICISAITNTAPASISIYWDELASKGDKGDASTIPGPSGGQIGNGYTYDTTTSGGSSASGSCRFDNSSNLTSATTCWLSDNDKDGNDLSEYILSFNDSTSPTKCNIVFANLTDNQEFIAFTVGSITSDAGGWKILELTESSSYAPDTTPFTNTTDVAISMVRVGDRGVEWRGDWDSATTYYVSDAVLYNSSTWVSTQGGSNQEPSGSSSYWDLMVEGGVGTGAGGVGAGYLFDTGITNDPSNAEVRFNNSVASSSTKVYVHELDLNGGNSEKLFTDWIAGNTSYVQGYIKITSANDNTRWWGAEITRTTAQGASVHELGIQNISTTLTSTFTDKEQVVISLVRTGDAGLHWMNEYSASQDYDLDDCVYYEGRAYVCTTAHSAGAGSPQSDGTGHWIILVTGFEWRDNWSSLSTYYKNDIVHYAGNTYLCKFDSVTISPTNALSWDLFTSKGTNGQNGSDGTDGQDGADNTTPIGTVLMFAGGIVPDDYLLCNGGSYSTSTYSELYGVIGTDYGGSGGNFNLPNLIGRFPLGAAQTTGHDPTVGDSGGESWTSGEIDVTIVKSDLPPHSHDLLTDHTTAFVDPIGVLDWTNSQGNPDYHSSDGTDDSNPFVKESISGVDIGSQTNLTVTPPFLALNFIIRYQ